MSASHTHEHDIEPGQSWEVDLFRPEDAPGVTRLFRLVYGEGYPVRTFIDPERLIEENAAGRTISSVARTPKGDIVGHNALFNSAPFDKIYEGGAGLVHPAYRGGAGIFTQMGVHGQNVAAVKFGVETIFGEPVCNHVFSQKMCAGLGWVTRAMEVDLMPAAAYAKEASASGRVTTLLDFRTLVPKPHTVHVPASYEEELRFAYEGFDDHRDFVLSGEAVPEDIATHIDAQIFDFAQVARLAVTQAGRDFEEALDRQETAAKEKNVIVIQVWVNLGWPWVGETVKRLRGRGYFLGGVLPRWFDQDGFLMQKIFAPPSWDGIRLQFDRSKKLLELVHRDWLRTQNNGGRT